MAIVIPRPSKYRFKPSAREYRASSVMAKATLSTEFVTTPVPAGGPRTIDELIRKCHEDNPERIAVVFDSANGSTSKYSTRDLDILAYDAALQYCQKLPARTSSAAQPDVVGLLGIPDFNYLVTMLALAKLGHATLLLSPRLPGPAYEHLLRNSKAKAIIAQPSFDSTIGEVTNALPHLIVEHVYEADSSHSSKCQASLTPKHTCLTQELDLILECDRPCWLLHSSGSTGMPKLVSISNKSAFARYYDNIDYFGFNDTLTTLPIFHAHGMSSFFRVLVTRRLVQMYDPRIPITLDRLKSITAHQKFQLFSAVPYTLKLLSETPAGVDFLRQFKIVTSGGGPVAENLGDWLVEQGVHLVSIYGSSESGVLLTSARPAGDTAWNYLRPPAGHGHLLNFEPQGGGLHELVAPSCWPPIAESNSPDGSWRTKDLFVQHPKIANAWKYVGRYDDVVVLENGEKVNPIDVEGQISKHPLVEACVIFGAGKPSLGVAIVASAAAAGRNTRELLQEIWPSVQAAQTSLPAYAKLSEEIALVVPFGTAYPRTDKGTVVRRKFYQDFAEDIEAIYNEDGLMQNLQTLSSRELENFVTEKVRRLLPGSNEVLEDHTDLFALGMDSLQATKLRESIVRAVDLQGRKLPLNVVFDNPTIKLLAAAVAKIVSGDLEVAPDGLEDEVQELISRYSDFKPHVGHEVRGEGSAVALTGATGSLGAHLLTQLLQDSTARQVYCLVRAKSADEGRIRVITSLKTRRLSTSIVTSALSSGRLIVLNADLSHDTLGLDADVYGALSGSLTAVYHCAWKVNFNQRLQSFEKDGIRGLRNLINLCMSSGKSVPARMVFFSSIAAIMRSPQAPLPERVPDHIGEAQVTGYGKSKFVAEQLCRRAAIQCGGFEAVVLRIGQIVGDTSEGVWNTDEAVPLMLRSARTIGALPCLDEVVSWLPVDKAASIALEIGQSDDSRSGSKANGINSDGQLENCTVYNMVNPHGIHWTKELLPTLRELGLQFEAIPPTKWLARLQKSSHDSVLNPPVKLLEYYSRQCGSNEPRPIVEWDTTKSKQSSGTFKALEAPSKELLATIMSFLEAKWAAEAPEKET